MVQRVIRGGGRHRRWRCRLAALPRPAPPALCAALWLAAVGTDAWWVATTTPFTAGADTAVAVGFALMAVLAGRTLRRRRRQPGTAPVPATGSLRPWVAVIGVLLALELTAYLAGGSDRQAWPTLSSLYDAAAIDRWAKGLFAGLWLAMGWGLFRR